MDGFVNGARTWLKRSRAYGNRTIIELVKSRIALFWSIIFPLFWYFATFYLFVEPQIPGDVLPEAKASNAVSFGMFGALTVSLTTFASALGSDISEKHYRKFRSLPGSPSADLLGRMAAGLVMATVSYVVIVAAGFVHGAELGIRSPLSLPIVAASLVLFCVIGMSVAVLVASVVPDPSHVTAITISLMMVLFFVTGFNGINPAFMPANPDLVNVIPNALATRLQLFHLTTFEFTGAIGLTPPSMPETGTGLAILFGSAVVSAGVALASLRRLVYHGEAGE